jgi:cobalt-precorrin-5B (C1)-methyltransferase
MAAALWAGGDDAATHMAVRLPSGQVLDIPVRYHEEIGVASAIKDGGDDIDQTNGIEIVVSAVLNDSGNVQITGGQGVGRITKAGLQIPIGEAAINPVPLQMIRDNLKDLLDPSQGISVEISIPRGEEVAVKTFNPKLGIVGGISIIGTTGIVEPMSEEAWKKSLEIELRQLRLTGADSVVLVPGNHGEKFAVQKLGVSETQVVTMSNFVGYMLMEAVKEGFKKAYLVGHIGKLIKVAGGIFHTHSRVADGRADLLCSYLAKLRAPYAFIERIRETNTTDEAVDLIYEAGFEQVFEDLAKAAAERATAHTYGELKTEVFLYDMKGRLLGSSVAAEVIQNDH